jgi:5-methylcytosine-specific restriction endonuclease McrA
MSGSTLARRALKEAARAAGERLFFTGEPCKRGHIAGWLVSSGGCLECERMYKREQRLRNPEAAKVRLKRYQEKNREKLNAKARANGKRHTFIAKRWADQNPERRKAIRARWFEANKERAREQGRRKMHTRRAQLRGAGGVLSANIAERLLGLQRHKCAACKTGLGAKKYHLDHITALASGGTNTDSNIQLLCPPCNLSKWTRNPIDFMQSRGYLL